MVALGTVPANKLVQICRRVNGSGTQAQFNAIFLNWPCDRSVTLPVDEPGGSILGPVSATNSGAFDVSRCLDDFNQGTNTSAKNAGLNKRWAIGITSTENNVDLAFHYRFIRIDGAAPTLQAVHAGDYLGYAEQSFQYRTNADRLLNATLAADKADTLTILAYMAVRANTPGDIVAINTNYVHTWGQGGWLVTPKSIGGFTPSNPFPINNPVNSSTRAPFGKAPNTCHLPTIVNAGRALMESVALWLFLTRMMWLPRWRATSQPNDSKILTIFRPLSAGRVGITPPRSNGGSRWSGAVPFPPGLPGTTGWLPEYWL